MKNIFSFPKPIVQKILFTPLIGAGCFLLGLVFWLSARDKVLMLLGLAILGGCVAKGIGYYRLAVKGSYEVVTGTCVGLTRRAVGKYQTVKMMDQEGIETTLRVNKQNKFKIGDPYRLYFTKRNDNKIGNDYLESVLAADSFLGYEPMADATVPIDNSNELETNDKDR